MRRHRSPLAVALAALLGLVWIQGSGCRKKDSPVNPAASTTRSPGAYYYRSPTPQITWPTLRPGQPTLRPAEPR